MIGVKKAGIFEKTGIVKTGGLNLLKIYNDGRRITVSISGDIDHHSARELRISIDEVIENSRPELLIMDMENVGFMDSSGVGLIIGRAKAVKAVGGELAVKNARKEIADMIALSGMSYVIATPRSEKRNLQTL